mmetsp:Transcript_35075/g.114304  ORF Transcript_35075/g.114304 Transcript_35075/m.114304 type:complete len:252 (-) Transcript_35075:216-971(-)
MEARYSSTGKCGSERKAAERFATPLAAGEVWRGKYCLAPGLKNGSSRAIRSGASCMLTSARWRWRRPFGGCRSTSRPTASSTSCAPKEWPTSRNCRTARLGAPSQPPSLPPSPPPQLPPPAPPAPLAPPIPPPPPPLHPSGSLPAACRCAAPPAPAPSSDTAAASPPPPEPSLPPAPPGTGEEGPPPYAARHSGSSAEASWSATHGVPSAASRDTVLPSACRTCQRSACWPSALWILRSASCSVSSANWFQ